MELEQRALHSMLAAIEAAKARVGDIAGDTSAASQVIVSGLLNGGKIFCCGSTTMSAIAQQFAAYLAAQFKHERPGLPVILLGEHPVTMTTISATLGEDYVFSHTIQSLGHENDVLVLFSSDGLEGPLIQAVSTAHERDLSVVAITAHRGGALGNLLRVGDIEVRIDSSDNARIQEIQLILVHCLCDLIDQQLFGVE